MQNKNHINVWILITLYFLSGMTSLAYEVLWVKLLAVQFGVSIFAAVITVVAFMAGLGAGSLFGARLARNFVMPLLYFGILEIIIGLFSLVVPSVFSSIDPFLSGLFVNSSVFLWYTIYLGAATCILFVPAFLMGLGFPVILNVIRHTPISLGKIYGVNTVGGATGALLPLILLPAFGWLTSLRLVVFTSLLLGITAIILAYKYRKKATVDPPSKTEAHKFNLRTLTIYAGIGAVALMLEIGWTRLFGMVFLRTEYVLAIILAVFLTGVGVGSLIARHLKGEKWFTLMPVLASGFSILSLWLLPFIAAWLDKVEFYSFADALLVHGGIIAAITFPVTLVFGAWLPLLNAKLGVDRSGGAWLYGANSVGAALGALLAGFVMIPVIGTMATLCVAALLCFVLGMAWSENRKAWAFLILLIAAAVPVLNMPPVANLQPSTYANSRDIYLFEDALSITHVVEKNDGQRMLLSDLQRMDASTDPASVAVQKNQARLPLILHPDPKSILFLGLGTGISAAGSIGIPGLQRTAVEISRGAITASKTFFNTVNNNITEQMHVVHDDAKRFLINNPDKFDVIVGDLFHPDLVGRSTLLSTQQFQRVYDHLNEDGVFVQWVALNQFDIESLNIVLRTFKQVFKNSVLFIDAFRIALVGIRGNEINADKIMNHLGQLAADDLKSLTGGEGGWTWLGRYWGEIQVDNDGLIQDEWRPQIEFHLPRIRYHEDFSLVKMLSYLLSVRPHLNTAATQLAIPEKSFSEFERSYIATELAYRAWLALFNDNASEEMRLFKLAYQANRQDRWVGFVLADRMYASLELNKQSMNERDALQAILKVRDDHPQALLAMWRLEEKAGNTQAALRYKARLKAIDPLNIVFRKSS